MPPSHQPRTAPRAPASPLGHSRARLWTRRDGWLVGALALLLAACLLAGSALAGQNALLATTNSRIDRVVANARHNGVWRVSTGDRLHEIAALLLPDDLALQQRLIGDLRRTYPEAITDHDTGDLRHGSLLKLPDYALVIDAGATAAQASAGEAKNADAAGDGAAPAAGSAAADGVVSAVVATVVEAGAGLRVSGTDGRVRQLAKDATLNGGETLISGPGRGRLRLSDGTRLSLRPRSALLIGGAPGSGDGTDAWQMQLLRGGMRLQHDTAAPFALLVRDTELRSQTRDLSLRLCSAICEDSRGKRHPAGVYALLGDGELQLRSPAGEQRFSAGRWLHLPGPGEPAIALSEQPSKGFAVPEGETRTASADASQIDARTLAQYSRRLTPLVYQAINSTGGGMGGIAMFVPEGGEHGDVLSFVPGEQVARINPTRDQRTGGDNSLWVESRQSATRQLPGLRLAHSPFDTGNSITVPKYIIRSPSLPPAGDPLWVEDALGRERPAATFGGLCLGGRCNQAQSPAAAAED